MGRTHSDIDKIRAELTWVTETPDPDKCGCRNVDAVRKLDTSQEHVPALSQRSSGPFGGSTIASPAVNTDGAEVRVVDT